MHDGEDAAKYVIHSGLDTTDCLSSAVGTSVALRPHVWIRSTGFSSGVHPLVQVESNLDIRVLITTFTHTLILIWRLEYS